MTSRNIQSALRKSIAHARRKREVVQRQTGAPLRAISSIERVPGRLLYRELLSCGHYGEIAEGPKRLYIAFFDMPVARRCKVCQKEK